MHLITKLITRSKLVYTFYYFLYLIGLNLALTCTLTCFFCVCFVQIVHVDSCKELHCTKAECAVIYGVTNVCTVQN